MRIPVIVLSGFLGSGKTTLLLSLLKENYARGLRPGVLMNELGMQDVDGYILEEQTGAAVEKLLDGCVCCSRKEELGANLELLIERRPDVIYIELTGVANPDEIAQSLLEPYWDSRLSLHSLVTLVDAEHVLDYGSRLSADKQLVRTLRSQLAAAHLIIVNKSDLVEQETLWKIEKLIRKQNASAGIEFTIFSRISLDPLLEGIVSRGAKPLPKRAPAEFKEGLLKKAAADPGGVKTGLVPAQQGGTEPGPAPAQHGEAKPGPAPAQHGGTEPGPVPAQHGEAKPVLVPAQHAGSFSQVGAVTLAFPQGKTLPKAVLESFFREWADRLLRAKGHVRLPGGEPVQLVQHAGARTTWENSRYPGTPYVVFIGMNIDKERLAERWSALFR
ncbi:CobW family GTP-binding protein [Paenibacillus sabinae]|uniref:GTPase (G3E family) protein n=1 Tax=Paenibacillus sabinae T27 TaxID=1268072 RepID=X4ZB61_9BACL|nr:CobW family GTP-binding protein [Paenibacillus sabinae]AHV96836.1 GTPase (G3E family) protein [Paenibacillus sabinae T27]